MIDGTKDDAPGIGARNEAGMLANGREMAAGGGPPGAVLIGCGASTIEGARRELDELGTPIEAEVDDIREVPARLEAAGERPRLFLAELKSLDEARHLARLNEAFPGRPILALVDPAIDPSLFLRAMRAGAVQVVRIPIQADDFRSALERLAFQFAFTTSRSEVIIVSGVKPGCGATTVAINLAAQIAHGLGLPTILIELTTQLGRLATYLNIEPACTTHDLLSDPGRLDLQLVKQSLTRVDDDLHVLAGPFRAITPRPVAPEDMLRLIGLARRLAGAVVISAPDSFDGLYFEAMAAASRAVLVAEQKVSSLYALRMIHDTLEARGLSAPRTVVLNRFDPRLRDFSVDRVEAIAGVGNVATVANDYAAVVAAENHGFLLRREAPKSRVLKDIDDLARRLLGRDLAPAAEARPSRGLGAKLSRMMARSLIPPDRRALTRRGPRDARGREPTGPDVRPWLLRLPGGRRPRLGPRATPARLARRRPGRGQAADPPPAHRPPVGRPVRPARRRRAPGRGPQADRPPDRLRGGPRLGRRAPPARRGPSRRPARLRPARGPAPRPRGQRHPGEWPRPDLRRAQGRPGRGPGQSSATGPTWRTSSGRWRPGSAVGSTSRRRSSTPGSPTARGSTPSCRRWPSTAPRLASAGSAGGR